MPLPALSPSLVPLSPTTFFYPCPRHLHRFLAEVHNWSRHNVLHDRIMPPLYILLHLIEPPFLYLRLQRWLLPTSICNPSGMPPSNSSVYPVLKPPQFPAHAGGHHLFLRPIKKYLLNHCIEEHSRSPWFFPLPSQYSQQPCPTLPLLIQVPHHHRPIIIRCHHDPPQLLELHYQVQGSSVGL